MNKLADAVNPEADDEFSYREGTPYIEFGFPRIPTLPNFMAPPAYLRNPVIPPPRTFNYDDAIGAAWGTKEHLLHRLEDVAATFGVDLEDRTNQTTAAPHDPVHHPSHYTSHPSGVECIDVAEHWTFCLGNALKYLWRAGSKGDTVEDLEKSVWYIRREIERLSS